MSTATANYATYSSMPRLRLTLRGRRVITALIAIPIVVLALFTILNGGTATATSTSSAPLEYVSIESGQSLWQLAESIAPESDPRDVISDILSFNQLESSVLTPGQQLAVPTQYVD
jgi:hypothetical protein